MAAIDRHLSSRAEHARRRIAPFLAACALVLPLALSSPALGAACEGDECQGPPSVPEEIIPGTAVVVGPPNPPVHFPKEHGKNGKKKKAKKRGKDQARRRGDR